MPAYFTPAVLDPFIHEVPSIDDRKAPNGSILSIDPSGGGVYTAIGIVALYVYNDGHIKIAHAVSVSVDPRFYLYSIGSLIKAHALELYNKTGRQPRVFIESIDRVSYTGDLFRYMHPNVDFPVGEISFDESGKLARFARLWKAIAEKKIRIRNDLVVAPFGLHKKANWDEVAPLLHSWRNESASIRLIVELRTIVVGEGTYDGMDDVAMALANGVFEAFAATGETIQ
jgi:hypothetical protein